MSDSNPVRFDELQQRYRTGNLPWDHELPPPEIQRLATRIPPGRMLDLGCGTCRAGVFMAQRGWQVDGVDYVPEAIDLARARVLAANLEQRIRLHVGSVTALDFLSGPYDLAVDVGCMHGLGPQDQQLYAQEVARLLRPGAHLVLFAHLHERIESGLPVSTPIGSIEGLFANEFLFITVEHGTTTVGDTTWPSAWYELVRR